jgi:two-component system sensor histidine kinase/response regulator
MNIKLMIVDDHAGVRGMIRHLLSPNCCEVCECASGDEAVRLAPEFKPDYVTMDVRMPGLCAFTAVRAIRDAHAAAKVIMVSSYDEPELRKFSADAGAMAYVQKENLVELLGFVNRDFTQGRTAHVLLKSLRPSEDLPMELRSPMAQLAARIQELEMCPALIANELRRPLEAIQNLASLLQNQPAPQSWTEAESAFRRIQEMCEGMNRDVETLISLAVPGPEASRMQRIATHQLVADCWRTIATPEQRRRVDFKIIRLPEVYGDAGLIRLLFSHLLDNAVKFSGHRAVPMIELNCFSLKHYTVFAVSDNGIGFDMQHAERLFTPLGRLHPLAKFPGVGLGLALARRILHQHCGRIWADAAPDKGATFYFTLPHGPVCGGSKEQL